MTVAADNELAKMIRAIAREEAQSVLATLSNIGVYRSRGGVLPPDVKTARGMVSRINRYGIDHQVEGDGTRRVYICTQTQWAAGMRRPSKAKPAPLRLVTDDEEIAEQAMAGAGLRSTRGGK